MKYLMIKSFYSGIKKIPLNTIGILKDYELNLYLDDKLATRTRFFRKLKKEDIMKWQSSEISQPLIKIIDTSLYETALSMFNRNFQKIIIILKIKCILYQTQLFYD